jgi:hypothetical protein
MLGEHHTVFSSHHGGSGRIHWKDETPETAKKWSVYRSAPHLITMNTEVLVLISSPEIIVMISSPDVTNQILYSLPSHMSEYITGSQEDPECRLTCVV